MSIRDDYQPGAPCLVAAVEPDADSAVRFYADLFGWEAESLMPPDSAGRYWLCRLGGRDVAAVVSQHGAPPPPAPVWSTHVSVESADDAVANARAAGGTVIGEPFDSPGGGRAAVLSDPAGAVFCVWEPSERVGAQRVNEPGAWSMSLLNTPDPEGAKAFYAELFGWESEPSGDGITVFRLPGYVGGEPQQPVPRDVVAATVPTDGQPSWSVDFWTADAEGAAARAAELGGSVVMPPSPAAVSTTTVLADPQGAVFSVSQVGPPP
jgi:predicted enzyme related to lactoylglutathione lyase